MPTDPLTPEKLEELKRLLAEATPGPWTVGWNENETIAVMGPGRQVVAFPVTPDRNPYDAALVERVANQKLIAYMRDTLPDLIEAAERAEALSDAQTEGEKRLGLYGTPITIEQHALDLEWRLSNLERRIREYYHWHGGQGSVSVCEDEMRSLFSEILAGSAT